jgi:nitrate reductase delta subunit
MSRLLTRRRATAASPLSAEQLRVAWQSASLLLGYPDEELVAQLSLVEEASHLLPASVGQQVRELTGHLSRTPLEQLQAEYVETFDTRRRTNLFLTYFAHGDTRKRGMALLRFKQTYLRAGHQLPETGEGAELPDHLCVVGATVDPDAGWRLLTDHRAGLELLRLALRDSGSPWGAAVDVVSATLPHLRGDEMDVVRRLAAEGPPEEEVGLGGYGEAELVPGAAPGGPPIGLPPDHPLAHGSVAQPLPFPLMPPSSQPGGER